MNDVLRLWKKSAPGALGDDPARDVPTITAYRPQAAAGGASIIICPGGGYGGLMDYEGRDYALWLNDRGITAFVLNYRLGTQGYRFPIITGDLTRAIRLVRYQAGEWGLDPSKIGVMGSSAGGHLAATSMVHFDAGNPQAEDRVERVSSRPDFGILCYAVISMGALTDPGSRQNLLGPEPRPEDIEYLSTERQVKTDSPLCFIWHTQADAAVKVENAMAFASACFTQNVPTSLHIYPEGPHGVALGFKGYEHGDSRPTHPWTKELEQWFKQYGLSSFPN